MLGAPPAIVITHVPTGTRAVCEHRPGDQRRARELAMMLMRSKWWAQAHSEAAPRPVRTYNLSNGEPYPNNLLDYRRPIGREEGAEGQRARDHMAATDGYADTTATTG
jgi:hypothetical protein